MRRRNVFQGKIISFASISKFLLANRAIQPNLVVYQWVCNLDWFSWLCLTNRLAFDGHGPVEMGAVIELKSMYCNLCKLECHLPWNKKNDQIWKLLEKMGHSTVYLQLWRSSVNSYYSESKQMKLKYSLQTFLKSTSPYNLHRVHFWQNRWSQTGISRILISYLC